MTSLHDELEKKLQDSNATPMFLPLQFLKAITCDFSPESELGRGGFGVVYKGALQSGKIIAVKKLFEIHLVDDKTFQNEVSSLMEIKHQHVVQFVGYCAESSWETIKQPSGNFIWAEIPKRLLCFEYLCNQSLDKYISVPTDESSVLEWNMRYNIIKGICNGLNFLHEECRTVHLDLKPENILMDATMLPKIADFGLSRIFGNQQSRIITNNSVGSRGYMAPEYLIQGIISVKADIFSLGVLIIEITTGRRDYPYFQLDSLESSATSCKHFIEEVLGSWRYKFESTMKYIPMEKYNHQVKQCIAIALKCVDPCMEKRPTVKDVIQVLNAVDQIDEAIKKLPSRIQCNDKSLVLDTTVSNELILDSVTEDMSSIKTYSTVGDVKTSQESLLPTPLWTSGRSIHHHQQAAKEYSEMQQTSNKTSDTSSEMEAHKELQLDMQCTENLLILNTTASKNPTPQREAKFEEILSPMPTSLESSASNQNYQEGASDTATETEVIPGSSALLDVHPLELHFRFEPNKLMPCSLDLTNNTDKDVAFGLLEKSDETTCFLSKLPMFGIVDQRTTYTLIVVMKEHGYLPQDKNIDLILQYSTHYGLTVGEEYKQHFQNEEEVGNTVHKVTLKCVCALQEETIHESIPPSIKIISMEDNRGIPAMDARLTEPLIITSNYTLPVYIRDYTQQSMGSIDISDEASVTSVRYIKSIGWSLAGTDDGFIHVRGYNKSGIEKNMRIKAHVCTKTIKLWDCHFRCKCIQTFKEHSGYVHAVAFNPKEYCSFASASRDKTIKVWSFFSRKSEYTLFGHSGWVNSLDFFTHHGQQYLITGSDDKTAKIWDMQKMECVRTLRHRSKVCCVLPHPKHPVLVTGTEDGHVYLWSSINFRLKRILDIGGHKLVIGLSCFINSGRVVVAHENVLSVIQIRDEEEQGESSGSKQNENSISAED